MWNLQELLLLFLQGKDDKEQSKAEESKQVSDKPKDDTNSKVEQSASAKDTDSSDDDSSENENDEDKNDSCDSEVVVVVFLTIELCFNMILTTWAGQ